MKITSLEIKQHDFEKSFRGYSIDEVNSFLDTLAHEWDKFSNESKMLKMQLEIAEKETSKLREVEMTLIKTLRTAEDTSSRITQTATQNATKRLEEIEIEASKIIAEAQKKADQMINEANTYAAATKAKADKDAAEIIAEAKNLASTLTGEAEQKTLSINKTAKLEFEQLESNFSLLELKRNEILADIQKIVIEGQSILDNHKNIEYKVETDQLKGTAHLNETAETNESTIIETAPVSSQEVLNDNDSNERLIAQAVIEEPIAKELPEEEVNYSSAVNQITIENNVADFEIIEGIGPKIKEVLHSAGILSFRELATTPLYKIKEILEAAGPHYAIHDPSTWMQQAQLAEQEKWEELAKLKDYLVAGRMPVESQELESEKAESSDSNNEEMLDKVNKVRAALRKSMVEKSEVVTEEAPKTVNEFLAEKRQSGGSFFDNI